MDGGRSSPPVHYISIIVRGKFVRSLSVGCIALVVVTRSYLAGFFDGEGSPSAGDSRHKPKAQEIGRETTLPIFPNKAQADVIRDENCLVDLTSSV